MTATHTPAEFIHGLTYDDLPQNTRQQAELCLLDLIGVGIAGAATSLSQIIRNHAVSQFGGTLPMLFDGRGAGPAGLALAGGMTIDALDGHDGYNPAKGHVGCSLFPATFAAALDQRQDDGRAFLTNIVLGYELGSRLATALHGTVTDYHTSGAWVAPACAAVVARTLRLDPQQCRHAMGIAEYHGPRSQMMRTIDAPTMLKDGSGWGAMAGVSAAYLARDGFTGAPALTVEQAPGHWADLGSNWLIMQQYFKPHPVCRWAQSPIEAVLDLRRTHGLASQDVTRIDIESFHEATRLATHTPTSTEQAQYSTSFPCAVALVRGDLGPADVSEAALNDPEILRLSCATQMREHAEANAAFPHRRLARVRLTLGDGTVLESGWKTPRWDAEAPPSAAELRAKFHAFAAPHIGAEAARKIESAVHELADKGLGPLRELLVQPISRATTLDKSS